MNRITHHHGLPEVISGGSSDDKTTLELAGKAFENEDGGDLNVWMSRLRDTWFNDINEMKVTADHRLIDEAVNSGGEDH